MKILALEFSSPVRSVAVAVNGEIRGEAAEQSGRQTHAFALISAALQQANVSRDEIECIAVGVGPGSYAGVRIAIALAQGWQIARRRVRLLGISSAEAVAAQAGYSGTTDVRVVLDAQRDQFFSARYDASAFDRPRLVEPFHLLTAAEQVESQGGSTMFRMDLLPHAKTSVGMALPPRADFLARLAAQRVDCVAPECLAPIYVREAEFVKAAAPRLSGK